MATKRKPSPSREPKPLDALDALIARFSHDELIEATFRMLEAGVERADNYADAMAEIEGEGTPFPIEVLNEAIVFTSSFHQFVPVLCDVPRVTGLWHRIHASEADLRGVRSLAMKELRLVAESDVEGDDA